MQSFVMSFGEVLFPFSNCKRYFTHIPCNTTVLDQMENNVIS